MSLMIILLCLFAAAALARYLMGSSERRMLAEMSDAAIKTYAIFDEDGTPLNSQAEEYERRRKAEKEKPCKN